MNLNVRLTDAAPTRSLARVADCLLIAAESSDVAR